MKCILGDTPSIEHEVGCVAADLYVREERYENFGDRAILAI